MGTEYEKSILMELNMEKRNRPMKKNVVSLMCDNIKNLKIDVDEMAYRAPDQLVRFIHGQYEMAQDQLKDKGESQS
jgi:hypothetical protein